MRLCWLWLSCVLIGCFSKPPDVDYDAAPGAYHVGGSVTGMWDGAAISLTLQASGLQSPVVASVTMDGTFSFEAVLENGATYAVSIDAAPAGHQCTVTSGEGTIAGADAANVSVNCTGPAVDVAFTAPFALAFDSATTAYDLTVSIVVQSTGVTVTAPDATDIVVNGTSGYASGQTTPSMPLAFGDSTISAKVIVGPASRTYQFAVHRTNEAQQFLFAKAANADIGDHLGGAASASGIRATAVDGDTLVVGASGEASGNGAPTDNGASSAGAAYVFRRVGDQWTQEAYLKPTVIGAGDEFGTSVAISGDYIAIGAPLEKSTATGINGDATNNAGNDVGAAYVFHRTGATWTQEAYVKPSASTNFLAFGRSVALDGTTLAVGGGLDAIASNPGVYVFTRGTSWSQQAVLHPNNGGDSDNFGASLAVQNDTLVIGSIFEASCATGINGSQTDNSCPGAGAAYIFVRSGSTWTQQAFLKASNTDSYDELGRSVAIDGETVVVGAPKEDSGSAANQQDDTATDRGAAYVFTRSGVTWGQVAFLKSSDVSTHFGAAVGIRGEVIAVGADGGSSGGVVTLFRNTPGALTQASTLQPAVPGNGDDFGTSLALSFDTLVVGAPDEDTLTGGINPADDPQANSTNEVGAAYGFR